MFKKIAIMHGKVEFSKIKGSICNVLIETANVCNILSRPAVSNGLILVKLKSDLKYRGILKCILRTSSPTYHIPGSDLFEIT